MSEPEHCAPTSELEFVRLLTSEQARLERYVTGLLGDPEAARNVVQETNIVLWQRSADFRPGTSFGAWSRRVAYWQVMAFLRDRRREQIVFSETLVSQLAEHRTQDDSGDDRRVALRSCLANLKRNSLRLIRLRYEDDIPIKQIAAETRQSISAVKMSLLRLRRSLGDCVELRLSEMTSSIDSPAGRTSAPSPHPPPNPQR